MSQPILLRGAKQVLTLRGTPGVRRGPELEKLEIIEDGSVFIRDGKIASVGTTRRLENLKDAKGALNIPVHNCVVMPGFVDPSIQLSLAVPSASRVLKRLKLSDFYEQSLTLMRACLQHGTLNAGIRANSGGSSLGADISALRQLVRVGNSPVCMTRIWRPSEGYSKMPEAEALSAALHKIAKRKLADCVEWTSKPDSLMFQMLVSAAGETGMKMGLNWLGGEANGAGWGLARQAARSEFCSRYLPAGKCDELVHAKSIAVFQAGGALLDDQPGGSMRDLVDAGGGVALGSGYDAVHEPNYNMQLVLALAVMRLRLTIEQAIVASTINAAYALNCGDEIGSLEPGKRADVLVLNLSDYREIPRRMGVNHVAMAIRDGVLAINRTRWRVGAA